MSFVQKAQAFFIDPLRRDFEAVRSDGTGLDRALTFVHVFTKHALAGAGAFGVYKETGSIPAATATYLGINLTMSGIERAMEPQEAEVYPSHFPQ